MCIIVACNTNRRVVDSGSINSADAGQRLDKLMSSYKLWTTMSVPVKLELTAPTRLSLSGRAYMVRDSLIHISLRFLGIAEVAVVRITPDSVYCVDKVHQMAIVEGINKISDATGITVTQLQDLLIGMPFVPGSRTGVSLVNKDVKLVVTDDSDNWTIQTCSKSQYDYCCSFEINGKDNYPSVFGLSVKGRDPIECRYADWSKCNIGYMPSKLSVDMSVSNKRCSGTLKYTTSSVKIDNVDVPSFKRPGSSYSIIQAQDLAKILSSDF